MGIIDILESNSALDFNSDIYKAFILFMDIISSLLYISLQTEVGNEAFATASLAVFGVVASLSIITMLVVALAFVAYGNRPCAFFIADCTIIVGTLFYFVGDNLPSILVTLSEDFKLSCDQECIHQAQIAGRCLLFLAIVLFNVVPKLQRKCAIVTDSGGSDEITSENQKAASFLIHMLALMVEYDVLYTIVWGSNSTTIEGVCSASEYAGIWTCWSLSFAIWTVFVLVYFFLENKGCKGEVIKDCTGLILMMFGLVFVCVSLGIYLLGDNSVPIGCICNDGGFNSTISDIGSTFSDTGSTFSDTGSTYSNTGSTYSNIGSTIGCSDITGIKIRARLMGGTMGGVLGTVVIILVFLCRS